jgi:hypothetical protein
VEVTAGMVARIEVAETGRDGWEGLRGLHGPGSAWPEHGEPILDWLVEKAQELRRGTPTMTWEETLRWAIIHAWYEGHIEGYDHGQRAVRGITEPNSADRGITDAGSPS